MCTHARIRFFKYDKWLGKQTKMSTANKQSTSIFIQTFQFSLQASLYAPCMAWHGMASFIHFNFFLSTKCCCNFLFVVSFRTIEYSIGLKIVSLFALSRSFSLLFSRWKQQLMQTAHFLCLFAAHVVERTTTTSTLKKKRNKCFTLLCH